MADSKHSSSGHTAGSAEPTPKAKRRRLRRIVHDHKGTAIVEWCDAPSDSERQVFELEHGSSTATGRAFDAGSLAIEGGSEDSHDPYMRIPAGDRKRAPGQKTDLRKLSAWIKMMRELEEAKKRNDKD